MSSIETLPYSANLAFVEALYADYLSDPESVDAHWREYFAAWRDAGATSPAAPSFEPASIFNPQGASRGNGRAGAALHVEAMQDRVDQMVRAYRVRGHMIAAIDPLDRPRPRPPELEPSYYGFSEADMARPFSSRSIKGPAYSSLGDIYSRLRNTYCRYIGVQFMHIDDINVRHWLQERMEGSENRIKLSRREQLRILTRLTDAVVFEEFIQKKYIGAKRFSLEGAESLIPLLDLAIEFAAERGVDEIVIGMAHRGRLNVLTNITGKSAREVFQEFDDKNPEAFLGRGDVKYHLGYHCDWSTAAGKDVHVALCFNPSHLEFVNPVALGRLRAKQDRTGDHDHSKGMAIQVHGDAAFAGEGVIQETLNISELAGYTTGGALHVIVNNQIGFTTCPDESRSSLYASAIGKMLQIPIFHVNGEHPESLAAVVRLATEFRQTYKRDVVIDMYCYRRHGHNEADEPAFTQPLMYKKIAARKTVREAYSEQLEKLGGVSRDQADGIVEQLREQLEGELSAAREPTTPKRTIPSVLGKIWQNYRGGPDESVPEPDTGVASERLSQSLSTLASVPDDFTPHRKIKRMLAEREAMARGEKPLHWAAAELLAYATLACEGARVRLSGQDCGRGTFSHRHAILHDYEDGRPYIALQHLAPDQAPVNIINSPLCEVGVLGFDYGYSVAYPDALVLWEAQFGDFANTAQVIIDQFISSAEDKWHSLSGLVMLLPHGFEGQGPEHSSARLERYLTLCAEDNMQVANPTTPAQYFHVLRRQVVRPWRKPLIVMTPKSLLRHPKCVSTLDDLAAGRFERVLADDRPAGVKTSRVLLCSGKVFYDLHADRRARELDDVAIVRMEQYYPLGVDCIAAALDGIDKNANVTWVQEEPANMGAMPYLRGRFGDELCGRALDYVARPESASPATGSGAAHKLEQRRLLDEAFAERPAARV